MKQLAPQYGPSQPSTLLVLEEAPFRFAELQRNLGSEAVSVRLRCRVEGAWDLLKSGRVKMLVIGADIDLPAVVRLLTRLADLVPPVRVAVLITPETRDLEWSLRELGAVDVLATPFESRDLTGIVRREFGLGRAHAGSTAERASIPSFSNR